jgi:hypothetical protein
MLFGLQEVALPSLSEAKRDGDGSRGLPCLTRHRAPRDVGRRVLCVLQMSGLRALLLLFVLVCTGMRPFDYACDW